MEEIRTRWKSSKSFRNLMIAALVYVVLRMIMQSILLVDMTSAAVSSPEGQVASDLQNYINGATRFFAHEEMYPESSLAHAELQYLYSPAFALMFSPILLLPLPILVPLDVFLHIAAYVYMFFKWGEMFKKLKLPLASQALVRLAPVWLVFSAFWDDVGYLNIYIIMATVATVFIDAILEERLGWAVFWLGVIILPIKPHWAFAAALPLLLGRRRFFLQLVGGSVLAYLFVAGITILVGGIDYGLQQYAQYFAFLERLSRDIPWRGPGDPFLGYNHSTLQIVYYLFGVSPATMNLATAIKVILLVPLGWIGIRHMVRPANKRGADVPQLALDLGFALYLGAFIWLDMVWEISLGIAIYTYLMGTLENKKWRTALAFLFLPYALVDVWRLVSYLAFGDAILYDGAYVLTDPLIYLPWIMMVLLAFYGTILVRLWKLPEPVTP